MVDPSTLLIVNDNNFPFSNGRSFSKGGPLAADDNEFILVELGSPLTVDRRVLRTPSGGAHRASVIEVEKAEEVEAP